MKKGKGRPALDEKSKDRRYIGLKLTMDEFEELKKRMLRDGETSFTNYIRTVLFWNWRKN